MPLHFPRRADTSSEIELTVSMRTLIKIVTLVLATIVLLGFFQRITFALTLIIIAFFLALAINTPVNWLGEHMPGRLKHRRALATGVSYVIVIAVLATFLVNVLPPIIHQTELFITHAPQTIEQLRAQYRTVNDVVVRYHLQGQVTQLANELASSLQSSTASVVSAVSQILTSFISILSVLVLTFMMVVEGPSWVALLEKLVPPRHQARVHRLRVDMYRAARSYINGQVTMALIASLLVLPGLLIFHVSYPFALMALVFVCGLIPMVGHTIGALIVAFVALFHSPLSALGILIYYFLYQQVETYLIQPRLQANATNLSPLLVFLALLVGINYGGLVGGLVSIPLMACLRIAVLDYLERRYALDEALLPGRVLKRDKEA